MADEDLSKLKIDKPAAAVSRSGRRRPLFIGLGVLLIALLAALYFAGVLSPAQEVEVATVGEVYPTQSFTLLNASGYVVAQRKAAVASKVTGRLISLSVEEGTVVKRGDAIARLEHDDVAAAKRQAEANLGVARANLGQAKAELADASANFRRHEELLGKGYVSRFEYDAAEARHRKALAAVEAAKAATEASEAAVRSAGVSLEYTYLRAPFDAVVLTKNADIGDIVTPIGAAADAKAAVVTIADMGSLQVEVDVSESSIGIVKVGQPCEIQLDSLPHDRFRGAVHMVVPTADRAKATILVKVRFLDKDTRVLPEMSAKVAFLEREASAEDLKSRTAVSPRAVVSKNGENRVFIIRDGRAVETRITTGETLGDMIEVKEGLKPGDRIVARPSDGLRDGGKIRISGQ